MTTTQQNSAYHSGEVCREANMSIHANPHRNTNESDSEDYVQWIAGWNAQDELMACAELGVN